MNNKQWNIAKVLAVASFLALGLIITACGATQAPVLTASLPETSAKDFEIKDFTAVHAPVNGDTNQALIFGNLPPTPPAAGLSPDLAAFLGRWEGYSYAPPIKKDWKGVFFVQTITPTGGKAFMWWGTNLQYPTQVKEIQFRVVAGPQTSIEWQDQTSDGERVFRASYDPQKKQLNGSINYPDSNDPWGPIELSRAQSFYVYKDYPKYLAGKRITAREYKDPALEQFGNGYMLYLPEGYEADPGRTWPLLFFLHGYGDRGGNILLLAKASPFMMIREKAPLPFIIAAPLLNQNYTSFPEDYLDGALNEVLENYRVDQKRVYMTGLSMGGEGTYRFALHRPGTFAAIAPLCAYLNSGASLEPLKDLPVWAIHGADDTVVPLSYGQQIVRALKQTGGNVRFSILAGHDHDVWTDTYSDPQFYDWFLQYQKP